MLASIYDHTATVILLLEYGAQVDLSTEVRIYQCDRCVSNTN